MPDSAASLVLLSGALVASCTPAPANNHRPVNRTELRAFSAEEKRIAQALSLGSVVQDEEKGLLYDSLLCAIAFEDVREQIVESGVLSTDQQRAFSQAQKVYRSRASAGFESEEIDAVRAKVIADFPERSNRTLFVIGCLRDLSAGPSK